jgi:hypothetical protein
VQNHWSERNVNLSLFVSCIEGFFQAKGFNTQREDLTNEYHIHVKSSLQRAVIVRPIMVIVKGTSDIFMVEFLSEDDNSSMRPSLAITMFGGGSLLLSRLKSQEAIEKLEKEFWVYVENAVIRLTNSETQGSISMP